MSLQLCNFCSSQFGIFGIWQHWLGPKKFGNLRKDFRTTWCMSRNYIYNEISGVELQNLQIILNSIGIKFECLLVKNFCKYCFHFFFLRKNVNMQFYLENQIVDLVKSDGQFQKFIQLALAIIVFIVDTPCDQLY
eukprot:TRINITY_DN1631_c0_g1_i3.p3 TRINITY_DN1631_c0_g1~~TRINITY_DN1631_c0_g1_i3.p3  ORF type:complete len:135 (-),score=11.47 TRINITY_DN1631_c0_g1_i3:175-579(-)